ncbi:hypothetical protein HK101_004945 [Irineochytrium annulatum]|nr:hypothetical protein HK101_004945 [Irineochytrium annulatum]
MAPPSPSPLLCLPAELLTYLLHFIPSHLDLHNLSLTCRALSTYCVPLVYRTVPRRVAPSTLLAHASHVRALTIHVADMRDDIARALTSLRSITVKDYTNLIVTPLPSNDGDAAEDLRDTTVNVFFSLLPNPTLVERVTLLPARIVRCPPLPSLARFTRLRELRAPWTTVMRRAATDAVGVGNSVEVLALCGKADGYVNQLDPLPGLLGRLREIILLGYDPEDTMAFLEALPRTIELYTVRVNLARNTSPPIVDDYRAAVRALFPAAAAKGSSTEFVYWLQAFNEQYAPCVEGVEVAPGPVRMY